ncbi:MAG: hypothetical protein ACI9EF_001324 [Pseudohongiellaceae bacterium]|jgi:hypothetical protein
MTITRFLRAILGSLTLVLAFFLLGEALLRVQAFGLAGLEYSEMSSIKRVLMSEFAIEPEVRSQKTVGSWGLLPNTKGTNKGVAFEVNNLGLRGKDATLTKQPGTFRIVVLGGSLSMGAGVPLEQTWPHVLAGALNADAAADRALPPPVLREKLLSQLPEGPFPRLLQDLPSQYEVFNLSVPNTRRCLENQLQRAFSFRPDLILWQIGSVGPELEFLRNYRLARWQSQEHRVPIRAFALDVDLFLPTADKAHQFFELLPPLGVEYGSEHYIYPSDSHPDGTIHGLYAQQVRDLLRERLPGIRLLINRSQQRYHTSFKTPQLIPWRAPDKGFWEIYTERRLVGSIAASKAELRKMKTALFDLFDFSAS